MKRNLIGLICFFAIGFIPLASASARQFQHGVVVSAERYDPARPRYGKRTDAPVLANEYDYDISIRLNCSVYVGRYQSAIDYLPGAFARDQSIEVNLEKHLMFVQLPGTGELKMGIVRRYGLSGSSCKTGG